MNLFVVALNVPVLVAIALTVVVVRLRGSRSFQGTSRATRDLPTSMRPNRPGQELADVVTQWAHATGVLTADGVDDTDRSSHEPTEG